MTGIVIIFDEPVGHDALKFNIITTHHQNRKKSNDNNSKIIILSCTNVAGIEIFFLPIEIPVI